MQNMKVENVIDVGAETCALNVLSNLRALEFALHGVCCAIAALFALMETMMTPCFPCVNFPYQFTHLSLYVNYAT